MHELVERIFSRYGRLEARLRQAVESGETSRSIQDLIPREDQLDLLGAAVPHTGGTGRPIARQKEAS